MSKRSPSLHISEKDLAWVLSEVFTDDSPFEYEEKDMLVLAQKILRKAKTRSIAGRSIVASNQRTEKKVEKIKLSGRSETGLFAQILLLTRRRLHHRGITIIEPHSKEWPQLKEVCHLATDFCNEFSIPIKEGYKKYLDIAMGMMKNFSLNKFNSMHASICKQFEALEEIKHDPTPDKTEELYIFYTKLINEKLGWAFDDHKKNPEKYVCFVRAKEVARKIGVSYKVYIKSQFAGLEFGENGHIPDPLQLYGDKAVERLRKYCYANDISLKQSAQLDFKRIKNA